MKSEKVLVGDDVLGIPQCLKKTTVRKKQENPRIFQFFLKTNIHTKRLPLAYLPYGRYATKFALSGK